MIMWILWCREHLKRTMMNKEKNKFDEGQIMVEFSASMIIAMIMLFSVMMVFRWSGFDIGWRRVDHDLKMMNVVSEDFSVGDCVPGYRTAASPSGCAKYQAIDGPIEQIDTYFHKPLKMRAAWGL